MKFGVAIALSMVFAVLGGVFLMSMNKGETRIVVRKSERRLEILKGDETVGTYRVALGFAASGDKEVEGDGKTPLGDFYVFTKNDKSKFHLSLGLSYPTAEDAARGLRDGIITNDEHDAIVAAIAEGRMPPQKTGLGGEIYIHGGGTADDWTWGCVALDNDEMTEIFNSVAVGTKVTILP